MKIIIQTIISDYKNYLINEEKSPVTIEKYVRDVRAFYDWIQDNDALDIAYKNIHRNIKTENYTKDDVLVMKHLDNIQRALKITAYEAIKNVTNDKETQIYCEKTINEKLNKSCMLWKPE